MLQEKHGKPWQVGTWLKLAIGRWMLYALYVFIVAVPPFRHRSETSRLVEKVLVDSPRTGVL